MISAKDLVIGYKNRTIFNKPIHFNLNPGQLYVLLGRNGSGKSTLLRNLSRLQNPLAGQLCLNNRPFSDFSPQDFAKQLSIVNTQRVDFPFLNIRELVAMGRHPHLGFGGKLKTKDHEIVEQALEVLEIQHLAARNLQTCSDGERQSAMLARAIVQDTPIMLLDEITAHLDFVHRQKTFSLLRSLCHEQGKLLIIASHELELSLQYADQAIVVHNGNLLISPKEELQEKAILESIFEGYGTK